MDISDSCVANYESSFIVEGTSAVKIFSLRLQAYKNAAMIITDKEGPDTSLVYTYTERAKNNELLKGDYYTWKNNTYLVYEDIDLVREVNYKKQKAYQCNVSFEYEYDCNCKQTCFGYFVSSLAKYVDTTLQGSLNITDNEKPILVLPAFDWICIGLKLIISGKPYKIIDFDAITNAGIVYCSLDRDFVDKFEDVAVSEPEDAVLYAGLENEMDIKFGYFETDKTVEIVSKGMNKIKFIVPFGIDELTITTKNADKIDVVNKYRVVI